MSKIENLVPREVYNRDSGSFWKRLALVFTILFGIPMGIMALFLAPMNWVCLYRALIMLSIVSSGSLVFGVLLSLFLWYENKVKLDALYNGDPKLDVPPPPFKDFSYRLICTWWQNTFTGIHGVLYIGKSGLMFIPHKQTPSEFQERLEIKYLDQISVKLVEPELNGVLKLISKLLTNKPKQFMQLDCFGEKLLLDIPVAIQTIELIREKFMLFQED